MAHLTLSSPPSGVGFVGEMFGSGLMSTFVSSGYESENKDMKRNRLDGWAWATPEVQAGCAARHIALLGSG